MKPFDLHVLTMNKPFFEGKCSSLVVPIKSGQYGILADHCNWVSVIVPGEMFSYRAARTSARSVGGAEGSRLTASAQVGGRILIRTDKFLLT